MKTVNVETGAVGSQIQFRYDGELRSENVTQDVISCSRKILTLADRGLAVHSGNAQALVNYLSEQRHESVSTLDHVYCVEKSGWGLHLGKRYFVLGGHVVFPDGAFRFERVHHPGLSRLVRAIGSSGSLDQWVAVFKWVKKKPITLFTVGVSLAAPLLELLEVLNFVLHLWDNSTSGKTAAIQFALSIYGLPTQEGLLMTWRTTSNGLEGRAKELSGLPMSLDDNSQATSDQVMTDVIYMVGNGEGKQRAAKTGDARPVATFASTALSNGEKPCSTSNSLRGQEVRTLEYQGSPFGEKTPEMGKKVRDLKEIIGSNYGHVGQRFIRELVRVANNEDELEELRRSFREKRIKRSLKIENPYLLRSLDYVAAVETALTLLSRIFPELELDECEIDQSVCTIVESQKIALSAESDIDMKALRYVWERIISEPSRFHDGSKESIFVGSPHERLPTELWGATKVRIAPKEVNTKDEGLSGYGFIPAKLDKILKEGGFNPKSAAEYFKRKRWVWLREDGTLWTIKMGKQSVRAYVFDELRAKTAGILSQEEPEKKTPAPPPPLTLKG
jgi:hypothetical protein